MYELNEIKEYLKEGNRFFVEDVRYRESDGTLLLYVPREYVSDKISKSTTSSRQLKNIAKNIKEKYSANVILVYTLSKSHQDLEASMLEILNFRFDRKIATFFMSFSGDGLVETWIEVLELTDNLKDAIKLFYQETLSNEQYRLGEIHWLGSPDYLPTKLALLRIIKSHQPISLNEFLERLRKDYVSVDTKWLKSSLDQLRKKQFIHWQRPGEYVLTYEGLGAIPTGARRSSSDIERALALGRKKW